MSAHLLPQRMAMLTRHDKVRLIAPLLRQHTGIELVQCDSFDTDSLGSFAGEQPRFMSPAECALRKAALAAELTGEPLGLGSEGSFSAGPYGLGTFNLELLSCVNIGAGWVVIGRFYGPSNVQCWTISSQTTLQQALRTVPAGQRLLLQQHSIIYKGLTPSEAIAQAAPLLLKGEVELSYDLRAHCCPERQQHIANAAQDLAARLLRCCPQCATPGFWPDKAISGLPCEDCAAPTSVTRQRLACCQRCHYTAAYAAEAEYAAAQYCPLCNP
jgi:hypothetical protein